MALVGCPALVARTVALDAMPVPEDLQEATLMSANRPEQSHAFPHRFHSCACLARLRVEMSASGIDSTICIHPPGYIEWHKRSCPMLYIDTPPVLA